MTTGDLEWYHQYLETDSLDLDYAYERILVDLPFNGEMRQQVVTTGKIGIIESLDRTTVNGWGQGDRAAKCGAFYRSGNRREGDHPEVIPVIGETTFNCPADPGAKAWQATAYSPRTETLYLPTVEFCSNTTVNRSIRVRFIPGAVCRPSHACRIPMAMAISARSVPST